MPVRRPAFVLLALAVAAPSVAAPDVPPLASAPAPTSTSAAPARVKVFVADLRSTSLDRALVGSLGGTILAELARFPELDALGGEDVRRALEFEADKSALGCTDNSSCLAEVANAMGASLVIFGDVEQVQGRLVLNLNVLDVTTVRSLGRSSVRAGDFEGLAGKVGASLRDALAGVYQARGWTLPPAGSPVADEGALLPVLPLVTVGTGVVVLVAGVVVAGLGLQPYFEHERLAAAIHADEADARTGAAAAALDAAAGRQGALATARAQWEQAGLPATAGGTALAVIGAGVVTGGVVWLLWPGEE